MVIGIGDLEGYDAVAAYRVSENEKEGVRLGNKNDWSKR